MYDENAVLQAAATLAAAIIAATPVNSFAAARSAGPTARDAVETLVNVMDLLSGRGFVAPGEPAKAA